MATTKFLCCLFKRSLSVLIKGGQIADVLIAGVSKSFSAMLSYQKQ